MNETVVPEMGKNRQELVDLFRLSSRLMARTDHRKDHAHHAQAHVLSIIREKGPINQRELLEILDVRSSSLSELLRKLERNDLVVRTRSQEDRRSFIIKATEKSESLESDEKTGKRKTPDDIFACLDDAERQQLCIILEKLIQNMKESLPEKSSFRGDRKRGRGRNCSESDNGRHPGGRGCGRKGRASKL